MRVLRRKKRVEGWDESNVEVGAFTRLRENIRQSNRAWVIALIGVFLLGICLFVIIAQQEQLLKVDVPEPPHSVHGAYDDEAHRKFVDDFDNIMAKRGVQSETRFINSGVINIVVPMDTSSDDIVYMSGTAARAILKRFRNAPYVYVYVRDNSDPPRERLAARTQWLARRNDFEVVIIRPKGEDAKAPRPE